MRFTIPRPLLWLAIVVLAVVPGGCPPATPPPTSGNVTLSFPGTSAADPPLVLYSGIENGVCEKYRSFVANPTVVLNDVTFMTSCAVEIDVFAPGRGAWVGSIDPSIPGSESWLTEAITSGSLSVALSGLTSVPIRIWIVAATPGEVNSAETMRNRLLDKAYPVLETLGTGLTLDTLSTPLAPVLLGTPDCAQAATIASNPAVYDPARINFYFVWNYLNQQFASPAMNCWINQHPEIVFISWGNVNVSNPTLVHELGHALGLIHPKGPSNITGGHTYYVPGFDSFNFMASGPDITNVSIGQLYAMNFSNDSWLNRTGSSLARPVVRACQDVWGAGVCPALTLFEAGWPP
jgi:hypothetical protein